MINQKLCDLINDGDATIRVSVNNGQGYAVISSLSFRSNIFEPETVIKLKGSVWVAKNITGIIIIIDGSRAFKILGSTISDVQVIGENAESLDLKALLCADLTERQQQYKTILLATDAVLTVKQKTKDKLTKAIKAACGCYSASVFKRLFTKQPDLKEIFKKYT